MRININLASQPYEAARKFRRGIIAVVIGLALIAALLVGYIVDQRLRSKDVNRQLAQARRELAALDQEEAHARAILNKPANRTIADQSEFLNELFARKSLSWTQVFSEMEKIIPRDLHVVSMKPETTKGNDLSLRMIVATDSRDRAVELVRRMETSPHFRQAEVVAETVTTSATNGANAGATGPGNIQFDISAIYVPSAAGEASAQAATSAEPAGANTIQAQNRPSEGRKH